ncbi:MAG: DUF4846 domain-containing protein [Clostridia bacterium]|nr:DUF4846 domain-containing protein [Clostridia bacterium]
MKKIFLLIIPLILTSCSVQQGVLEEKESADMKSTISNPDVKDNNVSINSIVASLINKDGKTIEERFLVPEGFKRTKNDAASFGQYLRTLPLKPDGSRVYYFNGEEKTREVYDAVIDMDIGKRDLQQCADAVMRLRAEYLYKNKQYYRIHFNLTNGFNAEYVKWRSGKRIKFDKNNRTFWVNKEDNSDNYKSFREYLDFVFAYAGTLSLSKELKTVSVEDMRIGDVLIQGGSPGHCVIVVDMAENEATGEKVYIFAQSYMPAQDIQVLKNNERPEISPWYYLKGSEEIFTPEWTFKTSDIKRFEDK